MKRQIINSSNIRTAGYENGTLEIEFKQGLIYQYYGVPEEFWINLIMADSAGSYLAKNIKNEFPYKMMDPELYKLDKEDNLE